MEIHHLRRARPDDAGRRRRRGDIHIGRRRDQHRGGRHSVPGHRLVRPGPAWHDHHLRHPFTGGAGAGRAGGGDARQDDRLHRQRVDLLERGRRSDGGIAARHLPPPRVGARRRVAVAPHQRILPVERGWAATARWQLAAFRRAERSATQGARAHVRGGRGGGAGPAGRAGAVARVQAADGRGGGGCARARRESHATGGGTSAGAGGESPGAREGTRGAAREAAERSAGAAGGDVGGGAGARGALAGGRGHLAGGTRGGGGCTAERGHRDARGPAGGSRGWAGAGCCRPRGGVSRG